MDICVVILTYNHEKYIAQAMDSVLMQKTNARFKVVVADDGSTDKTTAILQQYKENFPEKIELITRDKNQGVLHNVLSTITKVKGKYIALLDGDDYWTFNGKLQKQFEFLEANKEFSGCFHDTQIIQHEKADKILFSSFSSYSEIYRYPIEVYPWDITNRLILPTSSLFFESKFLEDPSFKCIKDGYSIAWKITCLAIKYKKFYFFKENWSSYRNHMQGISKSKTSDFHLSHILFLKNLITDAYYKNIPFEIWQSIAQEYYILLNKLKEDTTKSIPLSLKVDYVKSEFNKVKFLLKKVK